MTLPTLSHQMPSMSHYNTYHFVSRLLAYSCKVGGISWPTSFNVATFATTVSGGVILGGATTSAAVS